MTNLAIDDGTTDAAATAPAVMTRILVALDQSDYANNAMRQAVRLASGHITGIHAYAAKLHDQRFRQMEGGLPEQYQRESEMEKQRDVHEDLIGMGLGLISDSYHDAAAAVAKKADVRFERLSPEGKNYTCVTQAMATGEHDVLFMGALGLGAVAGSTIGTVCERVVRRANMDVFVAKDRRLSIGDGPIVVGMDGSPKSFGALVTALDIGKKLDVPVHVVAAYDPFYHYVAFNKISTVLDEEAGKVFRFKQQEQLHEELIDDGIAKIYQAHLNVAQTVAKDAGSEIVCALVAGKPYQAIKKYVDEHKASLLVIGKTGVHADDGLDIGGNTENLLRMVGCHVWVGQAEHFPPSDVVAEETIMWSDEATAMINRAPDFVRGIARTGVIRAAQKQGHTFITTRFVQDIMSKMMPGGSGKGAVEQTFERLEWAEDARAMLDTISDEQVRENIGLRAEKSARRDAGETVERVHIEPFMAEAALEPAIRAERAEIIWRTAPLARLQRVPEAFRDQVRTSIENFARDRGLSVVDSTIEDEAFAASRMAMCPVEPGKE
ncbi:MAG: nucleotide-binding universal stress UspA family protein [Paracoccaceae bacterium]|jgi:nucleotide-binding universal stress UspA family protein